LATEDSLQRVRVTPILVGVTIAVCVVAATAVWFYWSPRLAAKRLHDAARAGDVEALNQLVDFPLLREQLKADLKTSLLESVSKKDDGFGKALAAGLGVLMIDGLVDQIVSPSGIAALVRYGSADSARTQPEPRLSTKMRYRDASTFLLTMRDLDRPANDAITFVFRRSGMSWRLVRLEIPTLR
jgi:hypothetical protein